MEYLEKYRENLLEAVAETSEEFMDRYFAGETFSPAEIMAALTMNVDECSIVPVAMGSPVNFQGVYQSVWMILYSISRARIRERLPASI